VTRLVASFLWGAAAWKYNNGGWLKVIKHAEAVDQLLAIVYDD
jgi:hypothetical protein